MSDKDHFCKTLPLLTSFFDKNLQVIFFDAGMATAASERICVAVRVRKPLGPEVGRPLLWTTGQPGDDGLCTTISSHDGSKTYKFDHVFRPNDGNEVVYDVIGKELIESAVQGVNATIFAYGQTGSGKEIISYLNVFVFGNKKIFAVDEHPTRDPGPFLV